MVSVVVPVYNVEKYLDKCMQSLMAQTYTNLEIILVDDGSTDRSGDICDKWSSEFYNIKVVHQKNSGVSKSRNVGIQNAKGDYIGFIDADDYIANDMYENLVKAITDGISVSACGYSRILENNEEKYISNCKPVISANEAIHRCLADDGWGLYIWNKLFSREAIFNDGYPILFPEDLTIGEDAVWLINVLLSCKKVSYYAKSNYKYIQRPGSAVSLSKSSRRLQGCQSRYEASYRGYEILKLNGLNKDSYLMLRRCVFSARDILCDLYITNDGRSEEWKKKLRFCLSEYRKHISVRSDFLFVCKNELILFWVTIHAPAKLIRTIARQK